MGNLGVEQVLNELGALAKRVYDSGVIDTEQRLTITYDTIPEKEWNIRGDGWYGDAHLERSSSYKFSNPTENNPQETSEVSQQFLIRRKEMQGILSFTKDFLVSLIGGVTSFGDFNYKVEDLIKTQKKNLNQAMYIGPTMRRALLTSSPANAATFTVDNVQYLHMGMFIDVYNAAGTVLVNDNHKITNITGLTITVSPNITSTSGNSVFLHEEALNPGTGKGLSSLPQQCDDGTDFPVLYENISRTTFPGWRGNRIDAASQALTNDILQQLQNQIRDTSGHDVMTENYTHFVHLDTVRRYIQIVLPQKRYVNAQKYDSGMEKPNMLEWNGRPIVIDPDCEKRSWVMLNLDYSGKMEVSPLGLESSLGGDSMKWKGGFMQGVMLTYYNGNTGNNKPNSGGIIKNLAVL